MIFVCFLCSCCRHRNKKQTPGPQAATPQQNRAATPQQNRAATPQQNRAATAEQNITASTAQNVNNNQSSGDVPIPFNTQLGEVYIIVAIYRTHAIIRNRAKNTLPSVHFQLNYFP